MEHGGDFKLLGPKLSLLTQSFNLHVSRFILHLRLLTLFACLILDILNYYVLSPQWWLFYYLHPSLDRAIENLGSKASCLLLSARYHFVLASRDATNQDPNKQLKAVTILVQPASLVTARGPKHPVSLF